MKTSLSIIIACFMLITGFAASSVCAQTLYRYKDDQGNWQFTDRPPKEKRKLQSERLTTRNREPQVKIVQQKINGGTRLMAINEWFCKMEMIVELKNTRNLDPEIGRTFSYVLEPDSSLDLIDLLPYDKQQTYGFEMEYRYMPGDPKARPDNSYQYRLPFAKGTEYPISQAYPTRITHTDSSSYHAIDFAMPEGTPVYSVRDGVVFATSYENYTGGTDVKRDLPKANVVRIAHDDGTMAVYAHLSWNAIRVKPGQRVSRGQYIANSGNTGFSSGPHLHFAVLANTGMTLDAIPVVFAGNGNQAITPMTGEMFSNIE